MKNNTINKKCKKIFGTDGIRGTYGEFPLEDANIIELGIAISSWANNKYRKIPKAIIAYDTRESSESIYIFLSIGLFLYDIELYDAGILPTPALAQIVQNDDRFDFGIMITASHNPYQDNGIKIIEKTGKLCKKDEALITELFYSKPEENFSELEPEILDFSQEALKKYINKVTSYFKKDFLKNTKIVLDCAHGATFELAPKIFKKLGAYVIAISNKPTGTNINKNCGSTAPQTLQKAVLKHNADIGFAFDGDGDRLTAVNKNGEIKNGDDIMCLLSEHPTYKDQTNIVGTIMTNYGLESHLKNKNKNLIRAQIGDKFVSKEMRDKNLLLGGEQSGHIVLGDYLFSGDGIFAALRTIETIKVTDNNNFETFEKSPQVMINVPVDTKKDLNYSPFSEIITEHKNMIQNGRLIVRYSGTENLLRVTVEQQDEKTAKNICLSLSNKLEKELNN